MQWNWKPLVLLAAAILLAMLATVSSCTPRTSESPTRNANLIGGTISSERAAAIDLLGSLVTWSEADHSWQDSPHSVVHLVADPPARPCTGSFAHSERWKNTMVLELKAAVKSCTPRTRSPMRNRAQRRAAWFAFFWWGFWWGAGGKRWENQIFSMILGTPGAIRTPDRRLRRPLLYKNEPLYTQTLMLDNCA